MWEIKKNTMQAVQVVVQNVKCSIGLLSTSLNAMVPKQAALGAWILIVGHSLRLLRKSLLMIPFKRQHLFTTILVKCIQCLHESNPYEPMMDLLVDIQGNVKSVEDALAQFTDTELLDGANKYKCDQEVHLDPGLYKVGKGGLQMAHPDGVTCSSRLAGALEKMGEVPGPRAEGCARQAACPLKLTSFL
ncbi:unnamed protein product [Sphagnum compactum]